MAMFHNYREVEHALPGIGRAKLRNYLSPSKKCHSLPVVDRKAIKLIIEKIEYSYLREQKSHSATD